MDTDTLNLCQSFIESSHLNSGIDILHSHTKLFKNLLSRRQVPDDAWNSATINLFLSYLSSMDSNNTSVISIGEREGRVFSSLVSSRNFNFAHGVGRSGDITSSQPKAAGSSILANLVSSLMIDTFKIVGLPKLESALMLPVATGMGLLLSLCTLRLEKPNKNSVLWIRADQKSAPKSIVTAGFTLIIVDLCIDGDEVGLDLNTLRALLEQHRDSALAVVSTTSCFSPRKVDDVLGIGRICSEFGVYQVVNNAYGLQGPASIKSLTRGLNGNVVDLFIQSTDKNFMVPVGGCVVAGKKDLVKKVGASYPGRASISPYIDMFITLVSMGKTTLQSLLAERNELYEYLCSRLNQFASDNNERIFCTSNGIAVGVTLNTLSAKSVQALGSILYRRGVSGVRTMSTCKTTTIGTVELHEFGHHVVGYPNFYLNCAASIGINRADVDGFVSKLQSCYREVLKKQNKSAVVL
ncbi:hypothetical protein RCL1_004519 [Eukaryota sp. TZLM3-RCL]